MKHKTLLSLALAALALLFAPLGQAAVTAKNAAVYFHADAGSYVGGGVGATDVTWTHGVDGVFSGDANYGSFANGVHIMYDGDSSWDFSFAAPKYDPASNTSTGQPLHTGIYTNAQRFPFNSPTKPGIDISGNGRGNNTESGWFKVLEISYTPINELASFAVDFRQYDERTTSTGPSLYGSLRFNSSIPLDYTHPTTPVPEPHSYAMLLAGLGVMAAMARRRAKQG